MTNIEIKREGKFVKFTNCPPEFELPVELLRNKTRKVPELKIPEGQARKFVEFYNDIVTEKDSQYIAIMFEIMKIIRNRSVRLIPPVNNDDYNLGSPKMLKWCIRDYMHKSGSKPFSFFHSTYHIRHTTEDGKPANPKDELQRPIGFDVVIDIDADKSSRDRYHPKYLKSKANDWAEFVENHKDKDKIMKEVYSEPLERAWKIINFIDEISPVESVMFSGMGLHITLPFDVLTEYWNVPKQEEYCPEDINGIYDRIYKEITAGAKVEDLGHSFKETQIIKTGFTISPKSNLVALPMTREQLENFNLNDFKIENVIKLKIRDMGTRIFG